MKLKNLVLIIALALSGCSFFKEANNKSIREISSVDNAEELNELGLYGKRSRYSNEIIKDKLNIYFNLPPYINPNGAGLTPALLRHIKNAQQSIKMAVFQFNQKEIFDALKEAASRGVKIYLSTDLCYSGKTGYKEYFDDLRNHIVSSGQSSNQIVDDATPSCETMFNHNKYMIFDDQIAWFGSFNPTNHGAIENVELAISFKDPSAVQVLSLDFAQLIQGITKVKKKGVYHVVEGNLESIKALDEKEIKDVILRGGKVSYPKTKIAGHEFEFILSPKVKSLTRIVEEIYASKEEVLFSSFAIADQMLISSLINKHLGKNKSPIVLLPHPGEEPALIVRTKENTTELKSDTEKKSFLTNFKSDLERTLPSAKNYFTPKGEMKSVFRYFYPSNERVDSVKVEGIFNNRVIEAETTKERLAKNGISLHQSNLNGELHNKLFLIDENVTIFGSHNFSQSAENSNDELTVIIKSNDIAQYLKKELFEKTKYFSLPTHENVKVPTIAITEVMSESKFQFKQERRVVDAGDYIEIYNFGDRPVNLLGFKIDDRFFPNADGETMESSTNPGFSGELVGFIPSGQEQILGTSVFDTKATTLPPKKSALIVGKYFQKKYFEKEFSQKFKLKFGKDPTPQDFPLLLTIGAYFNSVIGDSSQGLKSKDKITLYHIDNHTIVDRFEFPKIQTIMGGAVQRIVNEKNLFEIYNKKLARSDEVERTFSLKNGTRLADQFFGLNETYSLSSDWVLVQEGETSPGFFEETSRKIASEDKLFSIQGKIADVERNEFFEGFIVIKNDIIIDVIKGHQLPNQYPPPIEKNKIIFPGLIDGHNHLKYNFFGLWAPNRFFNNRYEWPKLASYTKGIKEIYKAIYTDIPECLTIADENKRNVCFAKERCQVLRFGEIKALLGGTTSIQGSTSFDETSSDITFRGLTGYYSGKGNKRSLSKARVLEDLLDSCSTDAAQNIERLKLEKQDFVRSTAQPIGSEAFGAHHIGKETFVTSSAAKISQEYNNTAAFNFSNPSGWSEKTSAFYIHLGEGIDEQSKNEWTILTNLKLNQKQTVVIHGLGLDQNQYKELAKFQVPMIWSPTSNALLYKKVAAVNTAAKEGVLIGLGSDWSLSGTKSMLYEYKVASKINDKMFSKTFSTHDLLKMSTIHNAQIASYGNFLGKIAKGFSADFFLVEDQGITKKPSDFLLDLSESKIHSTWTRGIPQTGNAKTLEELDKDLNLNLKVLKISELGDKSCLDDRGFLTTEENIIGLKKVRERYLAALNLIPSKLKNEFNSELLSTDQFCHEKEDRALKDTFKALGI